MTGSGESFFWIGLTDTENEMEFMWVDGSSAEYTNWGGGEPNQHTGINEDCTTFWYGPQWNDWPCTSSANFICMKSYNS